MGPTQLLVRTRVQGHVFCTSPGLARKYLEVASFAYHTFDHDRQNRVPPLPCIVQYQNNSLHFGKNNGPFANPIWPHHYDTGSHPFNVLGIRVHREHLKSPSSRNASECDQSPVWNQDADKHDEALYFSRLLTI